MGTFLFSFERELENLASLEEYWHVPTKTMMKCHMFFMWLSNFLFKNWCDSLQIFLCSITAVQGGISYRISFMHCVPAK